MNYTLIGLYGVYLVFVGMAGKSGQLKAYFVQDIKGFIPWGVAIVILKVLYDVDALRPAIKPFIFLAILTFVLKNWDNMVAQANQISGTTLFNQTTGPTSKNVPTFLGNIASPFKGGF